MSTQDACFMLEALELARKGYYTAAPNPCVGSLVVAEDQIVGRGFHLRAGEPHAEIMALREAGTQARDATLHVTLEPCAHSGRTPPCISSIVQAGVRRVITAMEDPNPQVRGRGHAALEEAGVAWESGVAEEVARELNREFCHRMTTGRPWVRVKQAISLDGGSALSNGQSQWITGREARADVQRLRARVGAILSTAATVRHDDARLNVRLGVEELGVDVIRQPLRVVIDRQGAMTGDLNFWQQDAPHLVYTLTAHEGRLREQLPDAQIETLDAEDHGVHLKQLLARLAEQHEINDVLIEAGPKFAGALLQQELVDELIVYIAPRLLGSGAAPLAELPPAQDLPEHPGWSLREARAIGSDIRAVYHRDAE